MPEENNQKTEKPKNEKTEKPVEQKPVEQKPVEQAVPAAEPKAEAKPQVSAEPAKAAESKKAEAPKEKAANCASCNKSIKNKRWYYRNGKYYCSKRCWQTASEKEKAPAKEAAPQ